jgi:outer membrane biosynthesis protein TonB
LRLSGTSRALELSLAVLMCVALAGCRHRAKVPVPPPLPPPSSVALVPAPEPATPPQVQPVALKPLPTPAEQPQPKKRKKKPINVTTAVQPPVEVATNTPPPLVNVVGSLTAGKDADPAAQQKAVAAITAVDKQLAGLAASTLEAQKDGVARVKNFLRQAHDALKSGDTEGALTLAEKAKVLLDDLLK